MRRYLPMFIHIDSETGLTSNEHLSFDDALRLVGTAALSLMEGLDTYVKENDAENYESVHGAIYDKFNIMAGNILDAFDSTRSPATDLTAEAILRAENEILDEQVPTLEPEEVIEIEVTPTETEEDETESPA
jgi:hypothetical protein